MKVVEYWHGTIKNYRYDGDVSASPSLIPARPRVGKWKKNWCGMLPSIILNVIFFIVAWMFRSKWFKIKVHIDIRNSNTSSILTKQLCLLKITWPKKVIPIKSYSLAMLYLHHRKYLIMHNPDDKPSNCFILLTFSNLFNFHAIHEREPWI